jgi:hypothetical protein
MSIKIGARIHFRIAPSDIRVQRIGANAKPVHTRLMKRHRP